MRNRLMALTLASLIVHAAHAPAVGSAQTTVVHGDWAAVEALPTGVAVTVETMSGDTLKGKLSGTTDEALTIVHKGKPVRLNRDNIQRVYRRESTSHGRGALLGAVIGGAIGVGTGLGLYLPFRDDMTGATVPAVGLLGAGIGAGVGAAFGRGGDKILIYQAR